MGLHAERDGSTKDSSDNDSGQRFRRGGGAVSTDTVRWRSAGRGWIAKHGDYVLHVSVCLTGWEASVSWNLPMYYRYSCRDKNWNATEARGEAERMMRQLEAGRNALEDERR